MLTVANLCNFNLDHLWPFILSCWRLRGHTQLNVTEVAVTCFCFSSGWAGIYFPALFRDDVLATVVVVLVLVFKEHWSELLLLGPSQLVCSVKLLVEVIREILDAVEPQRKGLLLLFLGFLALFE